MGERQAYVCYEKVHLEKERMVPRYFRLPGEPIPKCDKGHPPKLMTRQPNVPYRGSLK